MGGRNRNRRVHRRNCELHSRPDFDGESGLRSMRQGQADAHANLHRRVHLGCVRRVECMYRCHGRMHARSCGGDPNCELYDLWNADGNAQLQRFDLHLG
jgi:hypothetical protein